MKQDNDDFKFDDKFVRNYRFHTKGYYIVSIEPVTIYGRLYGKCPNGHSFETTFMKFMKDSIKCSECSECSEWNKL